MGSEFYSFEEAANRLHRSKRSIHTYVKQGFIRREHRDGKIVLRSDDVEQVAVELGADMPAFNRKNFFHLMQRLRKLEEDMTVVRHALEIRDNPLRPNKHEALGLHQAAAASVKASAWISDEIEMWADLLARFDEATLDVMAEAVVTPKPWVVFYQLCLSMMVFVSKNKDLSSQLLHKKLDEGRKKLRGNVLMWIEMGRGTIPESVYRELNNGKEDLLKRLAGTDKKATR